MKSEANEDALEEGLEAMAESAVEWINAIAETAGVEPEVPAGFLIHALAQGYSASGCAVCALRALADGIEAELGHAGDDGADWDSMFPGGAPR